MRRRKWEDTPEDFEGDDPRTSRSSGAPTAQWQGVDERKEGDARKEVDGCYPQMSSRLLHQAQVRLWDGKEPSRPLRKYRH